MPLTAHLPRSWRNFPPKLGYVYLRFMCCLGLIVYPGHSAGAAGELTQLGIHLLARAPLGSEVLAFQLRDSKGSGGAPMSGETILVADDEPQIRKTLKVASLRLKINNLRRGKVQEPIFMPGGAPMAHEVFSDCGLKPVSEEIVSRELSELVAQNSCC